ncbi:MAG: hypothetical protein GF353_21395 [Candidatus Lokiarchaeota archaeon]|nr:hypothetical protein [Candidatus Lokiarchaeota archaeon]
MYVGQRPVNMRTCTMIKYLEAISLCKLGEGRAEPRAAYSPVKRGEGAKQPKAQRPRLSVAKKRKYFCSFFILIICIWGIFMIILSAGF